MLEHADSAVGPMERGPRKRVPSPASTLIITMSGRDTRRVGSADRQDPRHVLDCAVRSGSPMPPDINHGDATGLVYTVLKMYVIGLVID